MIKAFTARQMHFDRGARRRRGHHPESNGGRSGHYRLRLSATGSLVNMAQKAKKIGARFALETISIATG